MRSLLVVGACLAAVCLPGVASAAVSDPDAAWDLRVGDARRYALERAGIESFAATDETGRLRGYGVRRVFRSASVLKAMLLVAYLRRDSVRDRALTDADKRLLDPMIRRSDNVTAGIVLGIVGQTGLYRLAEVAGMRHFRLRSPWGYSEITARDQARYFRRVDLLVPKRHRAYARYLLRSIVSSQRWGIAEVQPSGWKLFFKGGWGSGTGAVTHQVGLLENRTRRVSLAILTKWNPSHLYGTQTVRGIAARLVRGFPGTSASALAPASASDRDAWSKSTDSAPGHFDAYVREDGSAPLKVNPGGTQGIVGDLDGPMLAYTLIQGGDHGIRVVDTDTSAVLALPGGVNTAQDEWAPSLSGDRLLFGRVARGSSTEAVLLADLGAGTVTELARTTGEAYVQPGRVAGDFAVWMSCRTASHCRIVRRNLLTGSTVRVPNPRERAQFAPSVEADGTVYYAESKRLLCGHRPGLWGYSGGVRTLLLPLRSGTDVARTDPTPSDLRFDRFKCSTGNSSLASAPK